MTGKIEIGDTVRVKSGGPLMTVLGISDSEADVIWWRNDDDSRFRRASLPVAALAKVSEVPFAELSERCDWET